MYKNSVQLLILGLDLWFFVFCFSESYASNSNLIPVYIWHDGENGTIIEDTNTLKDVVPKLPEPIPKKGGNDSNELTIERKVTEDVNYNDTLNSSKLPQWDNDEFENNTRKTPIEQNVTKDGIYNDTLTSTNLTNWDTDLNVTSQIPPQSNVTGIPTSGSVQHGGQCKENEDCYGKMICFDGPFIFLKRCQCPPNLSVLILSSPDICYEEITSPQLWWEINKCYYNEQCQYTGSSCKNNKCDCQENYINYNRGCLKKVGLYDYCEYSIQCFYCYFCTCQRGICVHRTSTNNDIDYDYNHNDAGRVPLVAGIVVMVSLAFLALCAIYFPRLCRNNPSPTTRPSTMAELQTDSVICTPHIPIDIPPRYEELTTAVPPKDSEPPSYIEYLDIQRNSVSFGNRQISAPIMPVRNLGEECENPAFEG